MATPESGPKAPEPQQEGEKIWPAYVVVAVLFTFLVLFFIVAAIAHYAAT